jgi:hydrogenase maturation protein HypF
MIRMAITAHGRVQGVGLRPFVDRTAREYGISGWVRNDADAVRIEAQGDRGALAAFLDVLQRDTPSAARIEQLEVSEIGLGVERDFEIRPSDATGRLGLTIPADLAICAECAREIETPGERRCGYPFTNCTACGPRYSIVEALPFDRARTTLRAFDLCSACRDEYADASDRRYHAEAIACPHCGPTLTALARDGSAAAHGGDALEDALAALARGEIVAMLGIGGFQLLCDALDDRAVSRLRVRKRRPAKPFAVLFTGVEELERYARVSAAEAAALRSPAAPIVLLRAGELPLAPSVAPGSGWLGAMLAHSPLHRVLAKSHGRPRVCPRGNLADEPLAIDVVEASARFGEVPDRWLVHDRAVARPLDDSIVRVIAGRARVLRRARGYAPDVVVLVDQGASVVALGGHLKTTVTVTHGNAAVVGPHVGDLATTAGSAALERSARDLVRFLGARPEVVACDLHPDYASSRLAERLADELGARLVRVQHHHAHVAACLAELGIDGPVLGLAFDGAGYGLDGTIWGGEALVCDGARFERVAHLRPFRLPGGERAMRSPRRAALGLAVDAVGADAALVRAAGWFADSPRDGARLLAALVRGVNSPLTTSIGRLFDAIACMAGLVVETSFEAEAAIALEQAAERWVEAGERAEPWPVALTSDRPAVLDSRPWVVGALADHDAGAPVERIAARLHETLAHAAVAIADRVDMARVVISGGCFQNRILLERSRERLAQAGFEVFTPERVPPNDGGLSLGQAWIAREVERVSRGSR